VREVVVDHTQFQPGTTVHHGLWYDDGAPLPETIEVPWDYLFRLDVRKADQ
jgi:hypothetical protein